MGFGSEPQSHTGEKCIYNIELCLLLLETHKKILMNHLSRLLHVHSLAKVRYAIITPHTTLRHLTC